MQGSTVGRLTANSEPQEAGGGRSGFDSGEQERGPIIEQAGFLAMKSRGQAVKSRLRVEGWKVVWRVKYRYPPSVSRSTGGV